MLDPVPAIAETAATGETAALFADIREVYRVGVVNLVWRHLATFPGALPWVWGIVRPLYVDGTVAREAAGLHAGMVLPPVPMMPRAALEAAGLDWTARDGIGAVLGGYDRTNAMALIALSAVVSRLDGVAGDAAGGNPGLVPPAAEAEAPVRLPPLPAPGAGSPATGELVQRLNLLGAERPDPILASMYRHLSYWPPYLALAWAQLAPLDADLRLAGAIATTRAQARARAARIAGAMPAGGPDPALSAAIRAAVTRFTDDPIGRMVVICAMLRRSWPG